MGIGFVVGVLGVLLLSHAAYSTVLYKALLKITEEDFSGPPITVIGELLSGLILCMWAALTVPGKFLSILPDSDENKVVSLPSNLDFMVFNHRGRAFPSEIELTKCTSLSCISNIQIAFSFPFPLPFFLYTTQHNEFFGCVLNLAFTRR